MLQNLPDAGWLSVREIAEKLGITERAVKKRAAKSGYGEYQKMVPGNGGPQYRIHINSPLIPAQVRADYWKATLPEESTAIAPAADPSVDAEIYSSAPEYARRKADKYISLIKSTEGISGSALRSYINEWNQKNPEYKTSYPRLMDARKNYKEVGISALLGKWGKNSGNSRVPDELFNYFRSLYLKDGAPGALSCWKITLGWAHTNNPDLTRESFPSVMAFERRLKKEVLPEAIHRARYGLASANRKFGFYIKRDYSNTLAGMAWVSDHAQVDVACSYYDRTGRERYGFPWVTVWRDYKSCKWLGWDLHMEDPQSDYIFSAAFRGMRDYGRPDIFYLDNGKDFRSKDFTGGRRSVKLSVEDNSLQIRSLTGGLQIQVIFAWPYNPQSKPIERDFLKNKEWLSKHAAGYRGGNPTEKPEALAENIKAGRIETFENFEKIFDIFVREVINRSVITEGHCAGKCPDEVWELESPEAYKQGSLKRVTTDALKLLCCRTSGDMTISRRGVHDSKLDVDYYDAWMLAFKGKKVYLRRDPRSYQEAWVFDAVTNDYLDKAFLLADTPALARTDVERQQLAEAINLKRRTRKMINNFAKADVDEIPLEQKVGFMAKANKLINDARGYKPSDVEIPSNVLVTQMDRVLAEEKRKGKVGQNDLKELYTEPLKEATNDDYNPLEAWM